MLLLMLECWVALSSSFARAVRLPGALANMLFYRVRLYILGNCCFNPAVYATTLTQKD